MTASTVTLSCPHCQYQKSIPRAGIPEKAVQVNCPRCKKSFPFNLPAEPESPEEKRPRPKRPFPPKRRFKEKAGKYNNLVSILFFCLFLLSLVAYFAFKPQATTPPEPVKAPAQPVEPAPTPRSEPPPVAPAMVVEPVNPEIKMVPTVAVASEWGRLHNPGAMAPLDMFQVFYLNTTEPQRLIAEDFTDTIGVNYAFDQLHGIRSEDFGAYWVGNVEFDSDTRRTISVAQSHAESRIFIDGQEVYGKGRSSSFRHTFTRGMHTIEVEHVNNWHTTDLHVSILPVERLVPVSAVHSEIRPILDQGDSNLWFASVYESNRMDHRVEVELQPSDKPTILFLSSYHPVTWTLRYAEEAQLQMVLYASYTQGSSVTNNGPFSIKRLTSRELGYASRLTPQCKEIRDYLHCEGEEEFPNLSRQIEELTEGGQLTGFSNIYDTDRLAVPEIILDQKRYASIRAEHEKVKKRKAAWYEAGGR